MGIYYTLWMAPDPAGCEEDYCCNPSVDPPIRYHHSGHSPDPGDRHHAEGMGHMEVGAIAQHLPGNGEYLRVAVNSETVVLDRQQVASLTEALVSWLGTVPQEPDQGGGQ